MTYAIVTGVSKGLGESVAGLLLETGINVIGISRTANERLSQIARDFNRAYQHYVCDLSDLANVEETLDQILEEIFSDDPSTLYLINNAAVISPVEQAMNIKGEDLSHHIHVNTIAPMVMANKCLKKAGEADSYFVAVNVTSGAANSPIFGWSAYCSTKASINMFTRTVALEQKQLNTGNKIIAFDPGIMDTHMQEKIRSSSEDEFKDIERFRQYKENNLLQDPAIVAGILVDLLTDEVNLENGKIYSVNEYL